VFVGPPPARRPIVASGQDRPRGGVWIGLPGAILAGQPQVPSPVDLLEAVVAHLQADATLAATFAGRFVSDEEVVGSAFPYVILEEIPGPCHYQSRDSSGNVPVDDQRQVRVTIVATGKAAVRTAGRLVNQSLWDAPLVFSTGTLLWFRNEVAPIDVKDPGLGPAAPMSGGARTCLMPISRGPSRHNPELGSVGSRIPHASRFTRNEETMGYNITLTSGLTLNFGETPSSGAFSVNSQTVTLSESLAANFRSSGTLADQCDGLIYLTPTFVASTPQTFDLSAQNDPLGNAVTVARIRLFLVKWLSTTDNVPLLLGNATSNPWTGLCSSGTATIAVPPSSSLNSGGLLVLAPQTTGLVVSGTSKSIKLDPQTAAGTAHIIALTCSA
jgi:hypothetical protein